MYVLGCGTGNIPGFYTPRRRRDILARGIGKLSRKKKRGLIERERGKAWLVFGGGEATTYPVCACDYNYFSHGQSGVRYGGSVQ